MTAAPVFPVAKDDDDDDVAWALSTAHVQWKRGSQSDAVVWLRRAIDSAVSVGATWRAAELTRETDALEQFLLGQAAPAFPVAHQGEIAIDDFDGTDIIDEQAMSLPADTGMDDVDGLLAGDSTDERTDITSEDAQPDEAIEVEPEEEEVAQETTEEAPIEVEPEDDEEEVAEISDDEISDDEIADDDLGDELPRFPSEAPTASFTSPAGLAALEARAAGESSDDDDIPPTESQPEPPSTQSEPLPYEVDEDPSPTPVRLSVVDAEEEPAPEALVEGEAEHELAPAPTEPEHAEPAPTEPEHTEPETEEPELGEPLVSGVLLSEVKGFEDFPPETQSALARAARVERLAKDEEVSGFGLALVLHGSVQVMPAIADAACGVAGERELVYGRGSVADGVALRLVSSSEGTEVAVWDFETIEPPLADCPWVLEELRAVADKYQALAGVSMGPMGDRLDDMMRGMVLARCELVRLLPGEVLVEKGKPVGGLFIVGAGRIELGADASAAEGELGPGEFLFAQQIMGGGKAPTGARAGASGALVMATDRHAAHELMVSVPPLLELLAG